MFFFSYTSLPFFTFVTFYTFLSFFQIVDDQAVVANILSILHVLANFKYVGKAS